MFATDFIFDDKRASDLDLIICSFNSEGETVTGGEIEHEVIKAPNTDKFEDYGAQFNTVLTWKFSLIKNPYNNYGDAMYFDQYSESEVMKWLTRKKGYKWFHFDQEGYDDVWYKVYINATPHQVAGRTVGFDLTVTSNCGYGFSSLVTKSSTINSSYPATININTDIDDYIKPYIEIQGSGDFKIYNENDTTATAMELKNLNMSQKITLDSDYEIVTGLSSPADFNFHFLRLIDGENTITTDSESYIVIEMQYREVRMVAV